MEEKDEDFIIYDALLGIPPGYTLISMGAGRTPYWVSPAVQEAISVIRKEYQKLADEEIDEFFRRYLKE